MAGLLTEPSHTVVVAGPAVVAGPLTEPLGTSAVAGLLTEPPHAVVASGLQNEPLTVGSTIFVDLPEHGISADFTVREIRPCPTPFVGDGYLVTTKFIHENAEILNLRIEGSSEPIGTTASHPFWSADRQQFVAGGDLRVGENLLLADETTRRIDSITLRPNRETVYNIEVDGEHVFYVGEDGVLVHNSCDRKLLGYNGPPVSTVRHHIFNVFRGNSARSQKYRDFFKKHGISVDDYAVDLPESFHKGWVHSAGRNWTTRRKDWIDANPNATTREVFQQAGRMMDEFGISHLPIIPFR